MKKKLLIATILMVMLFVMTSCSEYIGYWSIKSVSAGEVVMTEKDIEDMGLDAGFVRLNKSGSAIVNILGDEYEGKWKETEDGASITYGDDKEGTLVKDGDKMVFIDAQKSEYVVEKF